MSLVNVSNMTVLDNPAPFGNPLQFEITFECLQPLQDDLEWKVVYVGSANSSLHDQTLDEILVGPVPVGINKFILQADPPDASCIPENDILGVTVILVTCSYKQREFLKVGYYVNNEYVEEFDEETGPPKPLDLTKVMRTILADKPRVTKFQIPWGDDAHAAAERSAVQFDHDVNVDVDVDVDVEDGDENQDDHQDENDDNYDYDDDDDEENLNVKGDEDEKQTQQYLGRKDVNGSDMTLNADRGDSND